jgi:hypothetical protein
VVPVGAEVVESGLHIDRLPLVALASLAALGPQGVLEFHQSIGLIYRLPDLELVTAYEAMHGGAAGWLAAAACAGLGLMAARHVRSAGPGPLMAAGLLASLLASPYANGYDLSVLVLAAWLTFHDYSVTPVAAFFLIAAWIALFLVHVTAWPEVSVAIVGLVLMLLWDLDRASVRESESSTTSSASSTAVSLEEGEQDRIAPLRN